VNAAVLAGVEVLDLGRVRSAGVLGASDNQIDPGGVAQALSAVPHQLRHLDLRHTGVDGRGSIVLLAGAERAASATRYVLGGGVPKRIKGELRPQPDVAAIRSVHR
jgi:hypothetical protein